MGLEDRLARVGAALVEQLAELGHVIPDLCDRRRGNGVAVQVVRDLLNGHHSVRVDQEDCQYRALLWPAEPYRLYVTRHLDGTEDAEIDPHTGRR